MYPIIGSLKRDIWGYMGGCQNYGPFLDSFYNAAPNIYDNHPYNNRDIWGYLGFRVHVLKHWLLRALGIVVIVQVPGKYIYLDP